MRLEREGVVVTFVPARPSLTCLGSFWGMKKALCLPPLGTSPVQTVFVPMEDSRVAKGSSCN